MSWRRGGHGGGGTAKWRGILAVFLIIPALPGCDQAAEIASHPVRPEAGNVGQGKIVMVRAACGSCHYIPGVFDADGTTGPPLDRFGRRAFIAGMLPNSPDNLAQWLRFSQKMVPGNAMPDSELTQREARDAAAYLESLR